MRKFAHPVRRIGGCGGWAGPVAFPELAWGRGGIGFGPDKTAVVGVLDARERTFLAGRTGQMNRPNHHDEGAPQGLPWCLLRSEEFGSDHAAAML